MNFIPFYILIFPILAHDKNERKLLSANYKGIVSWTWLNGSKDGGESPTSDYPGSRFGSSVFWDRKTERILLFGGRTAVSKSSNDLWAFYPKTTNWKLIKRVKEGERAPKERSLYSCCGTTDKTMVIFGGESKNRFLNDTWVFNVSENDWVEIKSANRPSSRSEAVTWCTYDHMYIYGGITTNDIVLDDFWMLNLSNLQWKKITNNHIPGKRHGSASWSGDDQCLYMFSGNSQDNIDRSSNLGIGLTNEMWKYCKFDEKWKNISNIRVHTGRSSIGELGKESNLNFPGARKLAATWTDLNGSLWMFGGEGLDNEKNNILFSRDKLLSDIWKFNAKTSLWAFNGGFKEGERHALYGLRGKSSIDYLPGPRYAPTFWTYDNKLYLYGGRGHNAKNETALLSDLWIADLVLSNENITNELKLSNGAIFVICFSTVAGVALFVGIFFFLKNLSNIPRLTPLPRKERSKRRLLKDVSYSRVETEDPLLNYTSDEDTEEEELIERNI